MAENCARGVKITMKKNIFFIVSVIINVLFIIIALIYVLTPMFDYAVILKSLPRMCEYAEKNQPDVFKNIKLCHINE